MIIFHLPSFLLIIGYVMFWIELFVLDSPPGHTSSSAWVLWMICAVFCVWRERFECLSFWKTCREKFSQISVFERCFVVSFCLLAASMLLVALWASLQPPHLPQEHDAINYHIGIPRQHLIRGSFAHILWSSADLYLLPLDYSLAPYWLSTALPNKIPQYFFVIGLLGVIAHLTYRLTKNIRAAFLVCMAILGSHIVGIQLGTAMLDLVMAYVFMAALDSWREKRYVLGVIEMTFYMWSKSFVPLQIILLVVSLLVVYGIARMCRFQTWGWGFTPENLNHKIRQGKKRVIVFFILCSVFVGGPFVGKSLYYTGTPLFPLTPFVLGPAQYGDSFMREAVVKTSDLAVSAKDGYGSGRTVKDFLQHLWLISVPEKGVNNRYDYPVGLPYLLFLGPFIFLMIRSLRRKHFSVMGWAVIWLWMIWWLGSHQTRFLYVPLILMFVSVATEKRMLTRVLFGAVLIGVCLTALSTWRSHRHDFKKTPYQMLRKADRETLKRTEQISHPGKATLVDHSETAFAGFAMDVKKGHPFFVFQYREK